MERKVFWNQQITDISDARNYNFPPTYSQGKSYMNSQYYQQGPENFIHIKKKYDNPFLEKTPYHNKSKF
jgi:hypothetical protein